MREVLWGKLVVHILEEGIRVVGEFEKELAKQAEQVKAETSNASEKPEAKTARTAPKAKAPVSQSLQNFTIENLEFQGYEVKQDILPNLIHVHENEDAIAHVIFGEDNKVYIEPAVTNLQTKPMEASMEIERIKGELLSALRAECSNEIIRDCALELTDAYVGEKVAKEDVEAFDKFVQTLTSLMVVPQGTH